MIYDFHTHTFLSDGSHSPIELIRLADVSGYSCIALTDHVSYSNIDEVISSLARDCELARKYWDIIAIPGVELTNVPAKSINEMAKYAKEQGARMVAVHGESIAESVEPGTNLEAVNSKYVDMLAHPGFITEQEAVSASRNDIYLELTSRSGHCLSNGHVARAGVMAGAKFLINSDAHDYHDLYREGYQEKIGIGAGLDRKQVDEILGQNCKRFLKKLLY